MFYRGWGDEEWKERQGDRDPGGAAWRQTGVTEAIIFPSYYLAELAQVLKSSVSLCETLALFRGSPSACYFFAIKSQRLYFYGRRVEKASR